MFGHSCQTPLSHHPKLVPLRVLACCVYEMMFFFSVRRTQFMALWFCLFLLSSIIFQFPCSATVYNLPFLLHFFFSSRSLRSILHLLLRSFAPPHSARCVYTTMLPPLPSSRPTLHIVLRCCQRWKIILFGWKIYILDDYRDSNEPKKKQAHSSNERTDGMET